MKVSALIIVLAVELAFSASEKLYVSNGRGCTIDGQFVSVNNGRFVERLCAYITCSDDWWGVGRIDGCTYNGGGLRHEELKKCCK
uniref:Putative secreted peptide n=1 Tax=Rhipicephalus pulchellus TaxID=72859 RepID=L7M9B4_RHIPC